MITELKVATIPLTSTLAEEFSKMDATPGERPLSEKRVAYHTQRIERGEYHTPSWSFAWIAGRKVRVDGQHSSTAFARLNGKMPKGLKVTVKEFAVDDARDLAELFRRFDNPESVRYEGQAMHAHARANPELDGVPTSVIRLAVSGVTAYHAITDGVKTSSDDRCRLVYTHVPWILFFDKIYCARLRTPVVAAMYATHRKDVDAAAKFWADVTKETDPGVDSPSRVLARWMRDNDGGSKRSTRAVKFSPEEVYELCVHAWNAFRSGKTSHRISLYTHSKEGGLVRPK